MKEFKPLVVLGPTCVGKTEWLLSRFTGEKHAVVNVDSVQVYKYFDIGTAKPSLEERSRLPHFMVDEKDPLESLSVEAYSVLAKGYIEKIQKQGKRPIISGGTPYYLKHLLWGSVSTVPVRCEVRQAVASWIARKGSRYVYESLQILDPLVASRIHVNDIYRLSRAWEIYWQTGKIPSSFNNQKKGGLGRDFEIIGLMRSRSSLWQRASLRVENMLKQGLEEEVESLKKRGYLQTKAMQSIGYKEWLEGSKKYWSKEQIVQAIYIHTRQYIKRQITFFRSFKDVRWIDLGSDE